MLKRAIYWFQRCSGLFYTIICYKKVLYFNVNLVQTVPLVTKSDWNKHMFSTNYLWIYFFVNIPQNNYLRALFSSTTSLQETSKWKILYACRLVGWGTTSNFTKRSLFNRVLAWGALITNGAFRFSMSDLFMSENTSV